MKKILVLGSSHVGCLKVAARDYAISSLSGVSFHFFATTVRRLQFMSLNMSGIFSANTNQDIPFSQQSFSDNLIRINGAAQIDLTAYDNIVWLGLNLSGRHPLMPIWRLIGSSDIIDTHVGGQNLGLSLKTIRKIMGSLARLQINTFREQNFPHLGDLKLTVMMPPAMVESVVNLGNAGYSHFKSFPLRPEVVRGLTSEYERELQYLFDQQGIKFLQQPENTKSSCGLTKEEFNTLSIDILPDFEPSEDRFDPRHMNAAYGRECLHLIAETLGH